jgi:putative NADPH-quinone reductase
MTTIIYAHPLEEGMNASVRSALAEHLRASDRPYRLIDLYRDGFQPAMTAEERKIFFGGNGESTDALVREYHKALQETDHLVFMFPLWFYDEPAILKGFFDRVCLPNFAYAYTANGPAPLLTHIKKVTVLTTSGAPTELYSTLSGNWVEKHFIGRIVRNFVGAAAEGDAAAWLNLGPAAPNGLDAHIARIKDRFR